MTSKLQKRKEALARRLADVAGWRQAAQRGTAADRREAARKLERAERDVAALRAKLQEPRVMSLAEVVGEAGTVRQ